MLTRSWWFTLGLALLSCDDRTRLVPALALNQPTCIAGDFELARTTPAVMLVLDRSGSMATAFGSGSRWSTLRTTLSQTLPSLGTDVDIGGRVAADRSEVSGPWPWPAHAAVWLLGGPSEMAGTLLDAGFAAGALPNGAGTAVRVVGSSGAVDRDVATVVARMHLATTGRAARLRS